MTEQVEEKVSARRWVLVWAKDEKFWKDVAGNTIAGLLLVIIAYVYAVITGYIGNPGFWQGIAGFFGSITFTAGISALVGVLSAVFAFLVHRLTDSEVQRQKRRAMRDIRDVTRKLNEDN